MTRAMRDFTKVGIKESVTKHYHTKAEFNDKRVGDSKWRQQVVITDQVIFSLGGRENGESLAPVGS